MTHKLEYGDSLVINGKSYIFKNFNGMDALQVKLEKFTSMHDHYFNSEINTCSECNTLCFGGHELRGKDYCVTCFDVLK
jgi:hypothetical protein